MISEKPNNSSQPKIYVIAPCYNEENNLSKTIERILSVMDGLVQSGTISDSSRLLVVDDGSADSTWSIVEAGCRRLVRLKGLKLSRNYGHQVALFAGLQEAANENADCAISIDADLQQDERAIPQFLREYQSGAEIVLGVRSDRNDDSFFKKSTAGFFYSLMAALGLKLVRNHADYRLLGSKALQAVLNHSEAHLFLRGICNNVGFKKSIVVFKNSGRFAGKTKYSLHKMIGFAIDAIVGFSATPLRMVFWLGFLTCLLSIVLSIYVFAIAIFSDLAVPGWASSVLPIYFLGGIQIISIGIIGEYVGRIYVEVKKRPRFIIERKI
jgi:polyisoprenyl-phosphate glycosyltransferase